MRIGIVAGEASGDLLGAGLIRALQQRVPGVTFEGIAGKEMAAAGCQVLFPTDRLSVMGFIEVLARFRELHGIRSRLRQRFLDDPPDLFIGIDAPDFNIALERSFKAVGIPTVHYVSPTVWAWRQYRIRKIARSVDLMLTLFPFEAAFYENQGIPVSFVGHPLADVIPLECSREEVRHSLGLPTGKKIVALLPGSRVNEVNMLAGRFLQTAQWCLQKRQDLHFVAPLITPATRSEFERTSKGFEGLPLTVVDGQSRDVMAAADVVLLASGTATLEALLLNRPMVVAYRVKSSTYWLAKSLIRTPFIALANLLLEQPLVPEFLQKEVRPENLGPALLRILSDPAKNDALSIAFAQVHKRLRRDASNRAAQAIMQLLGKNHS